VGRYLLTSPKPLHAIFGFDIVSASVCGAAW
jgi:hypothetical protein